MAYTKEGYYTERFPTPWGIADRKAKLRLGVYEVGTPGHGGIMVGKQVAEECLSPAARAIGNPFGHWLAFRGGLRLCRSLLGTSGLV